VNGPKVKKVGQVKIEDINGKEEKKNKALKNKIRKYLKRQKRRDKACAWGYTRKAPQQLSKETASNLKTKKRNKSKIKNNREKKDTKGGLHRKITGAQMRGVGGQKAV